jgi:hypothetical protein
VVRDSKLTRIFLRKGSLYFNRALATVDARLTTLERTVYASHQEVGRLSQGMTELLARVPTDDHFIKVIEDLRKGLKEFTTTILLHAPLRENPKDDPEMQGDEI